MIASLALKVVRGGAPTTQPPAARMVLRQGETATISCTLTNSVTGAAENLTGGAVQFAARKRIGGDVVLSRALTIVSAVLGTLTLSFAYDDTAELATADYVCDIWYTDSSGNRYPVLGLSTLSIIAAVVTPGLAVTVLPSQVPLAQGPTGPTGATGPTGPAGSGTDWFDVTDYGAVGDGTTDDKPAIQSAIAAAIAAGGGTVYFPRTANSWRIKTEVSAVVATSIYPNVTLRGEAGGGPIRVAAASGTISGFRFDGFGTIDIENLTFIEEAADPGVVSLFYTAGTNWRSTVRNCQFIGVSSPAVSICAALAIFSQFENCTFGGCGSPSGFAIALRTSSSVVRDCHFIDYANYRLTYYSKSPAGTLAWIGGSGSWAAMQFDSVGNSSIVVERCHFDEAKVQDIFIYNSAYLTSSAPALIVRDCTSLLNAALNWYSVTTQGVRVVTVERHSSKSQANNSGLFNITYCDTFTADTCWSRATAGGFSTRSVIDAAYARIKDCAGLDAGMSFGANTFLATWEQGGLSGCYFTPEWTGGEAGVAYPVKPGTADGKVTYMRTTDTSDVAIGCTVEVVTTNIPARIVSEARELRMRNDAVGALVRGDKVGASTTVDAAVRKVTSGAYYGTVVAAANASAVVRVLWMPGRF